MSALMTSLASWLFDFAALATVLLATAMAARWFIRSPAQRMALAWSAWLGLAALAIVTALPQWPRFSVLSSAETRIAQPLEASDDVWLLLDDSPPAEPRLVAVDLPVRTFSPLFFVAGPLSWQHAIVVAWFVTVGLALFWIGLGILQTWRLLWRCVAAPQWIADELARLVGKRRRAPGLQMSGKLSSAAAVGAIRPQILLPQSVGHESCASTIRAALAHEWAHIRHGDLWLLSIERILLVLLAWHPLFWWLRRGVRLDQELLADAAAAGEQPVEYAEALLAWAKTAQPAPMGLAALSLWESPHTLSRRVTMLLDPNRPAPAPASRATQLMLAASLLALVGALSVVTLRPLTANDEPQPPNVAAEPSQSKPAGEQQVKVFELRRGDAGASAEMLRALLGAGSSVTRPLRISADRRTNSIIASGSIEDLEVIRGILTRLEEGSTTKPLPPVPAAASATAAQIVLKCTVLEVAESELAIAIPEVNSEPQPSPELAVVVQADEKWQTVLEKLNAIRGTRILSRPQLVTLSAQSAQLGIDMPAGVTPENKVNVTGLTIKLTPELLLRAGADQNLRLAVEAKQTGLATVHERTSQGEREIEEGVVLREFRTQVTAPVGKIVIVVDRSRRQPNALVLAIEPQVVQSGKAPTASTPPPPAKAEPNDKPRDRLQSIQNRMAELAQAQAQQRNADAGLRHELLRLRREIDQLLGQQSGPAWQAQRELSPKASAAANDPLVRRGLDFLRSQPAEQQAESIARSADDAERQTRIRLMELDRKDAELGLEAARADLARFDELYQKGQSGVTSAELARAKLAVRRAELQVEKLNVMLAGQKAEAATRKSPLGNPQPSPAPVPR